MTAVLDSGASNSDIEHPLLATLKRLGEWKDALLVAGPALYVLGYLTWSTYALDHEFGLLPALEAQYFIAGIIPLLVLILALGLVRFVVFIQRWIDQEPSAWRLRLGLALNSLGGPGFVLSLALLLVLGESDWIWAFAMASGVLIYLGAVFLGKQGDRFYQRVAIGILGLNFVLIPAALVVLYAFAVFPHIPVELGGPSPRCVEVDLATERVSEATLARLSGVGPSSGSMPKVVRSRPLDPVFEGSTFSLVRVRETAVQGSSFRLSSGTVLATIACD